ncbi:hypothetical protein PsYK624_105740 [Phanerochaete sordida]|uniref:Uncharacterized protein n=1 Tax=Phanerochaete sordida TaxID=48140 RepID=A0A9P3LGJ9_9APHY|nr:hypothetical protein PsYK624_105740 [Phanerochaete sordida]
MPSSHMWRPGGLLRRRVRAVLTIADIIFLSILVTLETIYATLRRGRSSASALVLCDVVAPSTERFRNRDSTTPGNALVKHDRPDGRVGSVTEEDGARRYTNGQASAQLCHHRRASSSPRAER